MNLYELVIKSPTELTEQGHGKASSLLSVSPVSYTHLDVYKRQMLHLGDAGIMMMMMYLYTISDFVVTRF